MKLSKLIKMWPIIPSSLVIVTVIILAIIYLTAYIRGDIMVESTGRADASFRVFYLENDTFPDNPIPSNLHFLMSFTDYIEVDSRFSAQLSENVQVYYSYTAVKRLVIRHMATIDGNMNPIVFESSYVLTDTNGNFYNNSINFPIQGVDDGPGGTYTIFPKDHIDVYLDFVAAQLRQMEAENVIAQNQRGFSAELFIDFTYGVNIPDWGVNETASRGYRMSLSSEVYSFVVTGNPTFDQSISLVQTQQITLPIAMLFVMVLSLSFYGLFVGIRRLKADPNEYRQEAMAILKKYSSEIVISDTPLFLAEYHFMKVGDFESLLKLAINLNKHIMCYQDDYHIEFSVIVEQYFYYYRIDYIVEDDELAITAKDARDKGSRDRVTENSDG